ncbi:PP2C family protein-serine/threonine phosphatase [Erwinia sp. DT-104]|uniref:PP2C family protein-serine/threonine phosphatase n=1 Tax=Erwinia sp. DT-104 TaxID=3396161 RepID=UPI003F1CBC22
MQSQPVLVVDDAATYRKLLAGLLKKWGYEVFEAENGEQALAVLAERPINLLISDWEMPVMDGPTLCQEVRLQIQDRYVYVIVLTARESVEDLQVGFAAGADDFLRKPVNQVELQARLHAGERVLQLEAMLAARNRHLSEALRQIEQDLQAAASLQISILPPHALQHGPYYADWLFIPSAWVSGDIFNLFPLDHQAVGFYCVDVAGHGVTAAMMSVAVARQFLHGRTVDRFLFSGNTVTPPAQVVKILNERFCAQSQDVLSYFTIVYGVIDLQSGEGRLCQAGHPTPFIVSRAGVTRQVGDGGPPVGLLDDLSWEESDFQLAPGERLCIYSDGISECENPEHEMFGAQRLETLLASLNDVPVGGLLAQVQHELNLWRDTVPGGNAPAADDISLLVIERQSPYPLDGESINEN